MIDPRCKCSMAISVNGDGCRYCQPQEYIDRLSEWLDDERHQLEASEARAVQPVAEQLSELCRGLQIGAGLASFPPHVFYLLGKKIAEQASGATESAILRKQAEAVEALASRLVYGTKERMTAMTEAQRLRQQADESEK